MEKLKTILQSKRSSQLVTIFVFTFAIAYCIKSIFYPGFMTYDTLHALRSARNGVTDSEWPPMVSYIWSFVEIFSSDPSSMHFVQISVLLFAFALICYKKTKGLLIPLVGVLYYLAIPTILGSISVIWKDILVATLFLASIVGIIQISAASTTPKTLAWTLYSLCFIFLATCTRHNAITGAAPLLLYLSLALFLKNRKATSRSIMFIILISLVATLTLYKGKRFLDHYSLPSFSKIGGSTNLLHVVRMLDVVGASICLNKSQLNAIAPGLTLDEIKAGYDPRHSNNSLELLKKIPYEGVWEKWIELAKTEPLCFAYNKYQLTKFLVGANSGEQFLITAPSVDANEFGYQLQPSPMRDSLINYVHSSSSYFFMRPWFIYLLSTLVCLICVLRKRSPMFYMATYSSGLFYGLGISAFGNAADARLFFYPTTIAMLIIVAGTGQLVGRIAKNRDY